MIRKKVRRTLNPNSSGYIDLSKRRVNPDFVSEKDTQYHQAKTVHSIIQHVADITDFDFEDLVKIIAWPLYKKFGFAYGAFQNGSREPEKVFGIIRFPDEKVRKALMNTIELRLKPKPTKLRADFEVSCFSKAGIDGVKDILYQGLAFSTKEVPIEIQLISPPLYTMIANALDVKSGLGVLNNALAAMERRSKIVHGNCVIKIQPRAVTAREDHSFHLLMEQLRDEREEHDDTDSEEEEEEEFIGL